MKSFNVASNYSSRAARALSEVVRTFFIIALAMLGLEGLHGGKAIE